MTPPLCGWCGVTPVKRQYGIDRPSERGLRIIAGVRWSWFCSRSCSAKDRNDRFSRESRGRTARANVIACERRVLHRLITATKDAMDAGGKVDPKDMVRAMMRELRKGYQRQYHRRRRDPVEEVA